MKKGMALLPFLCLSVWMQAQEDSTREKTLEDVVVSVSKWEQKMNEVPNKITKITKTDILRNNPQTSADLLGQSGGVFIQKSQLGGGSPMIRGFATNRVLLVVDGVRMNNAIYRSGNLQNVISIDPLNTETAEVIFGPGSLIYGSDAIGGVMDFHSLEARLSNQEKMLVKGSVLTRYSTANREKTGHADINLGGKKWALLASFSKSDFSDLRMGKYGGQDSYLRPEYVERIGNTDSIVQNSQPRLQRFSGYGQVNFMQKVRFRPNAYWDFQYSYTRARTGDAPRYDRLIQYRNGRLRFAEWSYGPMLWDMHRLQARHTRKNSLYDEARILLAYQSYAESRIDRPYHSTLRNRQQEKVDAYSLNWDASKELSRGELFFGLEGVFNRVGSAAQRTNIQTGSVTPFASRYPDGSTWGTAGVYGSYKVNLHPKLTLTSGLRFSYNLLRANFDTSFVRFPYKEARLNAGGMTGNAGLVFRPAEGWQINGNIATGFRMPNVDDIGKLFESAPGNVTFPNPDLRPEYAWNMEAGLVRHIPRKWRLELNLFFSLLDNAIVRRPALFNGQDSVLFEGILSQVEMLQNVAQATVAGFQFSAEYYISPEWMLQTHANLISGKETDERLDEQVPLRHAPPFFGSSLLRYRKGKVTAELSSQYNSRISNRNLAPTEQAKPEIYARDREGKPFSPGWYTLNLKTSCQLSKNWLFTAGWENMTNRRYRPYSSGIVAAGSNLIFSVRFNW